MTSPSSQGGGWHQPPAPRPLPARQGTAHYHAPGRVSSAIVNAMHNRRVRGKGALLPEPAARAMTAGVKRAPQPPTVPKERQAHVDILRKARRRREELHAATMGSDAGQQASLSAALDTRIENFIDEDDPTNAAWAEMLHDIEADVVIPKTRSSHQFSGQYEADLIDQVDTLKGHRKEHPEPVHRFRVAQCLTLLENMGREIAGPVSQFLVLCAEELRAAVYVPIAVGSGEDARARLYADEAAGLAQHLKELERVNAELQKALSARTDEYRKLVADFASDNSLLAKAKAEMDELQDENAKHVQTIQRQKDNAEFLDDQIDELQGNLEKMMRRNYPLNVSSLGPFSVAFSNVVEDSDKEMMRILSYKAEDLEELAAGRRGHSADPLAVIRRLSRANASAADLAATRAASLPSPKSRRGSRHSRMSMPHVEAGAARRRSEDTKPGKTISFVGVDHSSGKG
eukprot:TRINITY_DN3946_c0_g1_i1.p1 TRINITY_DN3946_c0_g1~~TRINITY_DN3946_c0_g1_i1.p1  ORF type:complete len:458 (+),score=168.71 TRINITY_DN3946_c0_g1_i1:96-1469(+)